ncbi:MAG: peptidylprolyl isomerase [Muribaculaceae bacterium]|nr:peptidylprolyl isomerase [Muribaculaceae bacterium]
MEKKEKVGPGMFVAYSYKLYNAADSTLLFEAKADAPDVMVYGVSQEIVPGLIAAIKDLGEGDKFDVTLPPAAAFGERFEENVVSLEKEIFERDGELAEEVKPGAELPMMTAEGYRILGRVLEIGDTHVKMDFNHPFAGMTVRFDGRIEQVREATPEEIKPTHGCGGCGGGCGEGSCGDNGCGGGCGEGSCCK